MARASKLKGFTIVELIIVIVVIGILAAVTVMSYGTSQAKARDTARLSSLKEIRTALESYRAEKGTYPNEATSGAWEYSYTSPATFLDDLAPYMGVVPLDPVNDTANYFYYHRYEAGTSGWLVTCPASRGDYYVMGVVGLDNISGITASPGWQCENATPSNNAGWIPTTTRAAWGSFSLAF